MTKRSPADIEKAAGIFRVCKGCGIERHISDYPDRQCGNPQRYCSTCRRKFTDGRLAEYLSKWMEVNGLTSHRVLLVGRKRK